MFLCHYLSLSLTRVMVHVVAQCHEEGLEHYLRSYVKVRSYFIIMLFQIKQMLVFHGFLAASFV